MFGPFNNSSVIKELRRSSKEVVNKSSSNRSLESVVKKASPFRAAETNTNPFFGNPLKITQEEFKESTQKKLAPSFNTHAVPEKVLEKQRMLAIKMENALKAKL